MSVHAARQRWGKIGFSLEAWWEVDLKIMMESSPLSYRSVKGRPRAADPWPLAFRDAQRHTVRTFLCWSLSVTSTEQERGSFATAVIWGIQIKMLQIGICKNLVFSC